MASALQLSATSSIINGKGLGVNPGLTSQIYTYQHQAPVMLIANIFANAAAAGAGLSSNLANALSNIGSNVSVGQFLIDFYPTNVTPTSSGNVYNYFTNNVKTASVSRTITNQANQPFVNGMSGFANVFTTSYSYAHSIFDTVASANMLGGRTYGQAGIGFTGPADLTTNGLAAAAPILANVVSSFGTMYDITNLSGIGNPYIFGQNLLNQGFGSYGNLAGQLKSAGLNLDNLLQVPQSSVTSAVVKTTTTRTSTFGAITLPAVTTADTTTVVSGTSTNVVNGIYKTVTGGDLSAIVAGTKTTVANVSITTLADFLDFNKVIPASAVTQLSSLGITNFNSLGSFLQYRLGRGRFLTWTEMSTFLSNLTIPSQTHTVTTSSTAILSANTISTIANLYSVGTGPLGNPIMVDYLGAAAGTPYAANLATINNNYSIIANSTTLVSNLTTLNTAVYNYVYNSGTIANVTSAVANVNAALNTLSSGNAFVANTQSAYYNMLSRLSSEVSNLSKAGATSDANPAALLSFAQSIGSTGSDSTTLQTYQFVSNIVTNDVYGDTVNAAISESLNATSLASKGIPLTNDPNPAGAIYSAAAQNIPLSTYITQNM